MCNLGAEILFGCKLLSTAHKGLNKIDSSLLCYQRKAFQLFVVRKRTRSKGFRKVSQGEGCFLGSVSSKSTVFSGLNANTGIHSYFPTESGDVYGTLFLSRKEPTETLTGRICEEGIRPVEQPSRPARSAFPGLAPIGISDSLC